MAVDYEDDVDLDLEDWLLDLDQTVEAFVEDVIEGDYQ